MTSKTEAPIKGELLTVSLLQHRRRGERAGLHERGGGGLPVQGRLPGRARRRQQPPRQPRHQHHQVSIRKLFS